MSWLSVDRRNSAYPFVLYLLITLIWIDCLIKKSYPDSAIQEVYVAEKTEGKLFKVILVIEGKEAIAIFNEKGEEMK